MSLSVVIITKNEEKNLTRCLESVKWADEIIVVDSKSTDLTIEIAQKYKTEILIIDWTGFGPAKNEGVAQATSEWILSIDADEVVTPLLKEEILDIAKNSQQCNGFYINRKTNFLGKWIQYSGWYPDYVLRLFRKDEGKFDNARVHEKLIVNGKTERLNNDLLHYSYPNLKHYFEKANLYTTLGARDSFEKGKKVSLSDITVRPFASFIKHYIIKQGYRDGIEGLFISAFSALSVMVKYAKLRELYKNKDRENYE